MKPRVIIHNHFSRARDADSFSKGQRIKYKGMPGVVEGPGPEAGMTEVKLDRGGKSLVVSNGTLSKG